MTHMQRVFHSSVQFRLDPADDGVGLTLGYVVGFQTEECWVIAMAMLATLPQDIFVRLDPLSQAMLEHRSEVITSQVQEALGSCSRPEDVLNVLSRDNFSSFFVTECKSRMLDVSVAPSEASMERMAQQFVLTLFKTDTPASAEHSGKLDTKLRGADDLQETKGSVPWMNPPKVWYRLSA